MKEGIYQGKVFSMKTCRRTATSLADMQNEYFQDRIDGVALTSLSLPCLFTPSLPPPPVPSTPALWMGNSFAWPLELS